MMSSWYLLNAKDLITVILTIFSFGTQLLTIIVGISYDSIYNIIKANKI